MHPPRQALLPLRQMPVVYQNAIQNQQIILHIAVVSHQDPIPISYPIRTSVVLPSQPRLPAAESMYLQVGSMWSEEITPALGGPGTIKKGTVECLNACGSFKSYNRRMS